MIYKNYIQKQANQKHLVKQPENPAAGMETFRRTGIVPKSAFCNSVLIQVAASPRKWFAQVEYKNGVFHMEANMKNDTNGGAEKSQKRFA
jgi:hypothetical protein